MRSPEEADAFNKGLPGGISSEAAILRGQEFGWSKIFSSAKKGKLSELAINSSGIQEFGQGIHALQDSYAHKGTDMDHHDSQNDVFPNSADYQGALELTRTAINVHSLISGDFKSVKKEKDGSVQLKDIGGMNQQQVTELFNKIKDFLKQK